MVPAQKKGPGTAALRGLTGQRGTYALTAKAAKVLVSGCERGRITFLKNEFL
jgi:hypothetical protein